MKAACVTLNIAVVVVVTALVAMTPPAAAATASYPESSQLISAQELTFVGRTAQTDVGHATFDWGAVRFSCTVVGTTRVSMDLKVRHVNKYSVFINSTMIGVVTTFPNTTEYTLADRLDPSAYHDLAVIKITEPDFNAENPSPSRVTLKGLVVDSGARLVAPADGKQAGNGTAAAPRRIEILGDSITCGYGVDGTPPCVATVYNENWLETYGAILCTAFEAECHVEAWSGRGVVQNYQQTGILMPALYERTVATDATAGDWNWASWVPDLLIINLGTNDFSHPVNATLFTDVYVDLLVNTTARYGPDTHILTVCGPMSSAYCDPTSLAVQAAAKQGVPVSFFAVDLLVPGEIGCYGHPNADGHARVAGQMSTAVSAATGWPVN